MTGEQASPALSASLQVDLRAPLQTAERARDRKRVVVVACLSLLVHALVLLAMADWSREAPPVEEAIPVELVTEPPPEPAQETPKPEEQAPTPPAPQQTIDEKPVNDFARATDQADAQGKDTPPDTPPQESEPAPDAKPEAPQPDPTPDVVETAPDGTEPAPPPKPAPAPAPPKVDMKSLLAPTPSFQFEAPAPRTDGPRGTAAPGYLSTLYARIMREMRHPIVTQTRRSRGSVVFAVNGQGRLLNEQVAATSGDAGLDAAALAAVRKASPFPPPPGGGPVFIRFDYGGR